MYIRINGAINEKIVSMSAKLTINRLDITLLLESYQLFRPDYRLEHTHTAKSHRGKKRVLYHCVRIHTNHTGEISQCT